MGENCGPLAHAGVELFNLPSFLLPAVLVAMHWLRPSRTSAFRGTGVMYVHTYTTGGHIHTTR
jgi:hypothetical protein